MIENDYRNIYFAIITITELITHLHIQSLTHTLSVKQLFAH